MPTYEFRCPNDNTFMELQQKEPTPPDCPLCNQVMARVWSAPAVQFKGSGFYSTGG